MIARGLALAGMLAAGLVIGVIGGFVQAVRVVVRAPWGAVAVPWGAVLATVTVVLAVRGAVWLARRRSWGWAVLGGWVLGTLAVATASASGDLAIVAGTRQLAYVLGAVVLGAAAATFPISADTSLTINRSDDEPVR